MKKYEINIDSDGESLYLKGLIFKHLTLIRLRRTINCYEGTKTPSETRNLQARGFTPIGMVEYWNSGKMGFGIPGHWVNGKIRLDDKNKNG